MSRAKQLQKETFPDIIRQEIESRIGSVNEKQNANPAMPKYRWHMYEGMKEAFLDMKYFIDSLPEEKPSDDIEQAAARYERENRQSVLSLVDIVNAFIAGAEWQNEQMMDEWLKDRDGCFWDGVNEGKKAMENQMPQPEDTVIFQKGVAEGRRLEREDGLAWQYIKSIVQIADKMLDDPKARVAFQNHDEEYYYKRVLDEYNKLHQTTEE